MDFIEEANRKIDEMNISWEIYGLIDSEENIFSLKEDTKILGRLFELMVAPMIRELASENDLISEPASSQTVYPDFTLMENEEDQEKIAVDVKSTYRGGRYKTGYGEYEAGDLKPFTYTLGSFASYLRNGTKNILYPYSEYEKHYVIGFLYSRNENLTEGIKKDFSDREEIEPPFLDVEYFIQEKYKIAGEKPGSGNTENIGSFRTNDIDDLREGNGPFAEHGEEVFEEYWRNYPEYREEDPKFTDLDSFFEWKEAQE
jgi:hypothetical protein